MKREVRHVSDDSDSTRITFDTKRTKPQQNANYAHDTQTSINLISETQFAASMPLPMASKAYVHGNTYPIKSEQTSPKSLPNPSADTLASIYLSSSLQINDIKLLKGPQYSKNRHDDSRYWSLPQTSNNMNAQIIYGTPGINSMANVVIQQHLVVGDYSSDILCQYVSELERMPSNQVSTIKFDELNSYNPKESYSMHLCLYLDSASTTQLKNAVASLRSGIKSLHLCEKISFHILFSPDLKWSDAPKSMIESYYQFMDTLKELAGSKVYQCSIIHKFDSSTVYITEIDALVALGKDITEDISRWYHLRVLDYSHNFLRLLPGVKFLDSLEILNIGGGGSLETLAGFKMPSSLRVLDVSNNQLKSLDYVFSPSLRRLDVLNNSIYSLDYVKLPQQLAVLDISHNRIDNIKYVNFPRDLTHLSISFNPMESMKGARFPEKLEYLDISCIPNESMAGIKFPDSILCLNLQLSMTNTRGLKLPPFVQELNMACNELNSINPLKLPNSIQKLSLANNNIKTLSKVTFPTALKELYLGNNLITTLKNVLFPPTLEVLDMEMNPEREDNEKDISSLKDVIFPPNLRVLRLGYHSIKAIESIKFPFSLEELSLQYNDIRMFRNVRFGSKLRYLDISGNQELMSVDNVLFPETLLEMKIPSTLLSNLPADIVKRANNRELILTKSLPYTI